MSNFLSVATVTAALSQVLQAAVGGDVPGAAVTTLRPSAVANGAPAAAVNLYLFQATPNTTWRNADLPTRRDNGDLVQRPRVALDLYYLLSFYGDESQLEPQRLLASAVRTLHAAPVLTRDRIRTTIADQAFGYLAGSNLADEVDLVRLSPSALNLEELSKLWSVFFQTPYALSVAYQASVVLIESTDRRPGPALPVRRPLLSVAPFRQPVVERVTPAAGPDAPIVAGSAVLLHGRRLRADPLLVRVGDMTVTPTAVTDARIDVTLPAGVSAGVQGIQVVHPALIGDPPVEHRGVESNVAPFVLRPTIAVAVANVTGSGSQPRGADVNVTLTPPVGRAQRVVLLLNELHPPSDRPPRTHSFPAPRRAAADPPESATLRIPVAGLAAGSYLVRVQVDGAESPLEVAADGAYDAPRATL